jgi:hypothetical protein
VPNKFTLFSEKQSSLRGQELLVAKINGGYISRDQRDRLNLTQAELLEIELSTPRLKGGFGPLVFVGIMLGQYAACHLLDEFIANPLRNLIEGDRLNITELLSQMEQNADERSRLVVEEIRQNFANHEAIVKTAFKLVLNCMSSMHTELLNTLEWRSKRTEVSLHINRIFAVMSSLASIELIYRDREIFRSHLERGFYEAMVDIEVIFRTENLEGLLLATCKRNLYLVELQKRELVAILQASLAIELLYIREFNLAYDPNALSTKYRLMSMALKNCIDEIYGTGCMRSCPTLTVKNFLEQRTKEHLIILNDDFSGWITEDPFKGKYEFQLVPTHHQGSLILQKNVIYLQEKNGKIYYSIGTPYSRKETSFPAPKPFSLDTLKPFYQNILKLATDKEEILSFNHRIGLAEDTHFFVEKRHLSIWSPSTKTAKEQYFDIIDQLVVANRINDETAQEMRNNYSPSESNNCCIT